MKTRRNLVIGAASSFALAILPRALAQRATPRRIALVTQNRPVVELIEGGHPSWSALLEELRRLNFVEGATIVVERHSALGLSDQYQAVASAVVAGKPDLIFVGGSPALGALLVAAAANVPIVFVQPGALEARLVTNLARPGGNVTGMELTGAPEIEGKRMALLHDLLPAASRLGYLTSDHWDTNIYRSIVEESARGLGMALVVAVVDRPYDATAYRRAFAFMSAERVEVVQIGSSPRNVADARGIGALAIEFGLPNIGNQRDYVDGGCLMSYGASVPEMNRRAAHYVARILNGEAAGTLPVQQPETYELVISLTTARELGIVFPPSILARADVVIE